jgi:hypothetical protein
MVRRLALLVALTLVVAAAPASGETTREARDRVRRERAAKAAELDLLKAEDAEVEEALAAVTAEVNAQQAALIEIRREVKAAEDAVAEALVREDQMTERVAALEDSMTVMAVEEFLSGGRRSFDALDPGGLDLGEWVRRNALADIALGSAAATSDALREAKEDLGLARERAQRAVEQAARQRDEAEEQLEVISAARDQQAAFASKLDNRIESRLAESANLAAIDARLSEQLAAEQAALARRIGGGRPVSPVTVERNIPLRTVYGITVHADLADNLLALLEAASADGVELSGWGYRDPEQQQALREAHCPDPVSSPAASCRPPTARPGHSMHERGLAVDFTQNGRVLSSSTTGYRWLRSHAARYGLHNLPGEPWHWSTNGR